MILAIMLACSSTDPATLPNRPFIGPLHQARHCACCPRPNWLTIASTSDRCNARARLPGSDIVIEAALDPGVNYSRYYVSYLSEGLKIYALMTVPDGEKPSTGWPVIIFNHGYIPPDIYRTTERYIAYVDLIARSGYIVFRSDYRGHDRSEGVAGSIYTEPNYTVDVLNGLHP
jgi:hypothetical protein